MNSEGITIKAEGHSYQLKKKINNTCITTAQHQQVSLWHMLRFYMMCLWWFLDAWDLEENRWVSESFVSFFQTGWLLLPFFFFVILLLFPSFWEKKYTFWSSFNEVNLYPECKGVRFFSTNLKLECAMK